MKVTDNKSSTTTIQRKTEPFFRKEGDQDFFSRRPNENAFFSPAKSAGKVQAKLTIGQPGDKYEQEADATADKVVQRLATPDKQQRDQGIQRKPLLAGISSFVRNKSNPSPVQAKCEHCEQEEKLQKKEEKKEEEGLKKKLQRKPIFDSDAEPPEDKTVQRKCAACEEEEKKVQKKEEDLKKEEEKPVRKKETEEKPDKSVVQKLPGNSQSIEPASKIEESINASKGSGNPLTDETKEQMESSIGADFSNVRVHNDGSAAEMSSSINAQAFTHGSDIYFNSGKYNPDTQSGQHLLAHELTHTIQQGSANMIQRDTDVSSTDKDAIKKVIEDEVESARKDAGQDDDLMLRAYSNRLALLLDWKEKPNFKTVDDAVDFVVDCEKKAETELDTLKAFSPAGAELAMAGFPKGFPLTWSGRIHEALSLGVDPLKIMQDWSKSLADLTDLSTKLGPKIYEDGLPVSMAEIARLDKFQLRIKDAFDGKESGVKDYAKESIRYVQLKWVSVFAFTWETMTNQIASDVADGKYVPVYPDWKDFVDNKQAILRDLPARAKERLAQSEEEVEKIQKDVLKLGDAALLTGFVSGLASLFAILSGWNEASSLFDSAHTSADNSVATSGKGEHFITALKWGIHNDYYTDAFIAAIQNIIAHGPEILAEMGFIVVLGMIPGVDIAVAIYLALTTARDVISLLDELATAISEVFDAKSVAELQKASARLAQVLVAGGIMIAIVLLTMGIAKVAAKLKLKVGELRNADKNLTEEAATKRAMQELSEEERKVLNEGPAKIASKFKEFEGVCTLGSIICRGKLPDHIVDEAGQYPKEFDVPMPKGTYNVRKAILAGVQRGTENLRNIVREDLSRWPEFAKEMAKAKKNGKDWVYDANGDPWEVHHIKPVFMGGTNAPENLIPLPKGVHQKYTNWWNSVHRAFKKRFTESEWDEIYWDDKNVPGSKVPKTVK